MKKNYFASAIIASLSLVVLPAAGQLSGLYTINGGQGTSGTNFQTFTAFATALNSGGVSGPVTVNVVANSGPYNEQVTFNAAPGVSGTNKVVINGNNNKITFNASSGAPHTIGMNSADWMEFKELQIEGTNATYAYPLIMYGGADNNKFTACTFSCNANQGTGTGQMPVVLSGSGISYGTASNSGSNNTWDGCHMFGGYYGICFYGPTTQGTYNFGNKILNCLISEFYYMGTYLYYHDRLTISGNTLERPTRTNLMGTTYCMYVVITTGTTVEKNKIRKIWEQNQTLTGTMYGILLQGNAIVGAGDPNYVRNNIISDIKWNGSIYAYYMYYLRGDVSHNTLVLDHTASTAGTVYGYMLIGTTGFDYPARNNIAYITKGGSGTKYGIYYNGTIGLSSDYNDIYVNSAGGGNYAGYYGGNQVTLANLQSASNGDTHSYSLDPQFANAAGGDYTPTNAALNNKGLPMGVAFDHNNMVRNSTTPDIGAIEFLTPVCSGAPGANSVTAPNFSVCPGESVAMGLTNLPSDAGLSFQWQYSTISNVGTWTTINGANGIFYTAPSVTVNTWYQVVVSCTASGGQNTSYVGAVMVSGPTQSTVPYFESFEGIGLPNRLPNCSWSTSSMGTSNLTALAANSGNRQPHTGNGFASFANTSQGSSYFYTNPIQMQSGLTYSAALWYATEYIGYNNWTNLAILVGPNQNPTGMVQVASVGPAISGNYKLLDNTFTVPLTGQYYVAIKATSINGSAMYLSWDDLSITIPCGPSSPNTPTVGTSVSAQTICAGQPVTITAGGADTYSWNTGQTGGAITDYPTANTTYIVTGVNAVTGCSSSKSEQITVIPSPQVYIVANNPMVCSGKPVILTALGAVSYAWSNGAFGNNIVVNPTANTTYQVIGTNNFNCSMTQAITINVFTNPLVTVTANNNLVCSGDNVTLTGNGALTYQWQAGSVLMVGNPLNVIATGTGAYTVIGTDANGCTGSAATSVAIEACTGVSAFATNNFKIYPNPTTGIIKMEMFEGEKTILVTDITGRIINEISTGDAYADMDISAFAAGVYYVKVQSTSSINMVKIVKE